MNVLNFFLEVKIYCLFIFSYLAKALEVFCYMTKNNAIKFKELTQLWRDSEKDQGFWIKCEDNFMFSFEKEDILIEYEYGEKNIKNIEKEFREKYASDYNEKYGVFNGDKCKTFYIKVFNRTDLMIKESVEVAETLANEFIKFKNGLEKIT